MKPRAPELVTIHFAPASLQLTAEARELARKVHDPRDLDEALLSARCDEARRLLSERVNAALAQTLRERPSFWLPPFA